MNYLKSSVAACFILFSSTSIAACISGYSLLQSATGVEMCGSGNTVVQTIDLSQGAKIKFLYSKVTGGYTPQTADTMWNNFSSTPNAFSVVNGSFFDSVYNGNPQKLAFLLKDNYSVIDYGYERNPYIRTLKINGSYAGIDDDGAYGYYHYIDAYSDALAGLNADVDTGKYNWAFWIGRNLIGTNDRGDKIFILISDAMTIDSAKSILTAFGATNIMMLDGGPSAQLRSKNKTVIGKNRYYQTENRTIPQGIGVISGTLSKPVAPARMSYSSTTDSITLNWSDSSNNEAGFRLYRWNGSSWSNIGNFGANVTSYKDAGLLANTTYYYTVDSYNNAGSSRYGGGSYIAAKTAPPLWSITKPTAPSNMSAYSYSGKRISVYWNDNSNNETGFNVYRWNGSSWSKIATLGANVTSYTNYGLLGGQTYYYTVEAYNSAGSAWSSYYTSATARY